jgi:hypothetical protein
MAKKNLGTYGSTKHASRVSLERDGDNVVVRGKFRNDRTTSAEQLADFSGQNKVSGSREVTNPLPSFNGKTARKDK